LGGCPYANGATGNISTEEVLFTMKLLNIETSIDLERVIKIGEEVTTRLGVANRSSIKVEDLKDIDYYRKMLI